MQIDSRVWALLRSNPTNLLSLILLSATLFLTGCRGIATDQLRFQVQATVAPVIQEHRIPGMAVVVVHDGRVDVFCFGVASRETGRAVDERTLFEVGSVSKTFTGLLGAYVSLQGHFGLDDPASRYWPEVEGTAFGRVTMAQLATYSAGGLPLQFPEGVNDNDKMLVWLRAWTPESTPGSHRQYSNPSIGLFGRLAAKSAGQDFSTLMTRTILPKLGLQHTYFAVPPSEADRYAFGYDSDDRPVRVNPGVCDIEAYGIKTCALDMGRYLQAQMGEPAETDLTKAITMTHVGRYSVPPMTQGMGWEMYPYPVTLEQLLAGNSPEIIFEPNPIKPAISLGKEVWFNKTGSTNGFSAYVAFVPAKKIGIALLANRSCPIPARVKAAHAILQAIDR